MALLFENKIRGNDRQAFISKVKQVAYSLGYDPDWLMFVINNESNFNAQAENKYSGAVGLIQFMPETAKWLGVSTQILKRMNRIEQLDWVMKYFQKWKSQGKTAKNSTDLALITFYPYAVNQPDHYKIGSESSIERAKIIRTQNPGLDKDGDGFISVLDYKKWLMQKLPVGLNKSKIASIIGYKATKVSLLILATLGLIFTRWNMKKKHNNTFKN